MRSAIAKKSVLYTLAFLTLGLASFLTTPAASAQTTDQDGINCNPNLMIYGRPECIGYFEGQPRSGQRPGMLEDGLYADNASQFITQMRNYVFSDDFHDVTSAAMIIDVMLGMDGPDFNNSRQQGVQFARENFQRWADYINRLDSEGRVEWNIYYSPPEPYSNSGFDTISQDISTRTFQATTIQAIRFNLGGERAEGDFLIDKTCGNIKTGFESAPLPQQYNLQPSVSASRLQSPPGETVNFEFNNLNAGPDRSQQTAWSVERLVFGPGVDVGSALAGGDQRDCAFYLARGASSCTNVFNGSAREFDVGNTSLTADVPENVRNVTMDYPFGTRLCQILTIAKPTQNISPTNRWSDARCISISKRPSVHFMGGDLSVGNPYQDQSATCSLRPDTGNIYTGVNGTNSGSSGEYASFVRGIIQFEQAAGHGFGTASRVGVSQTNVDRLAFANTEGSAGSFGNNDCMTDYYQRFRSAITPITGSPGTRSLSGLTGNQRFNYNGNLTIQASDIANGANIILVVNGNVSINGNIRYGGSDTPSYNGVEQIPGLAIITNGNISIAGGVTKLDGAYISKGIVTTCTGAPPSLSTQVCNQQLQLNGVLFTDVLRLPRTFGSEAANEREPAERFDFTTEMFFNNVLAEDNNEKIETVEQRDLPPRY